MIPDIVVLNEPGLDAVIFEPDPVALVVEVTSPSNAWVDRLVKPDAYANAGIPYFLRIDQLFVGHGGIRRLRPGRRRPAHAEGALPGCPGPRCAGHRHPLPRTVIGPVA